MWMTVGKVVIELIYNLVMLGLQCIIHKENNFKQAGERYRSFDPARFALPPEFNCF